MNKSVVPKGTTLARFGAFASTLLSRATLAGMVGKTFGGDRDFYAIFGWKRDPSHIDFMESIIIRTTHNEL